MLHLHIANFMLKNPNIRTKSEFLAALALSVCVCVFLSAKICCASVKECFGLMNSYQCHCTLSYLIWS